MENKRYIRKGYKENQKGNNENELLKAQGFFENLIWGIEEVCAYTKYAKGTIYNLVSRGEIPYRNRGRRRKLVFVPSEIIAWLKGEQQ